ncbi:DUF262 domain-containing protein [Aeromicrobium sp.]|uniref:DUF262 domain-containing protein n=1 Tax=Aeromicrobium sp. TaxID=1871063 RepID=UPI00198FBCC9|nr:DUF262 domain-containing protein [Aeromicrobium sp.]MBC7630559.1 DUF262 domain-containing protein [Aeromicrobium sp.]
MSEIQPEPAIDEVLTQLQQDVAERLATLSLAAEYPNGVSAVDLFEAEDVDFGSGSWRERLLSVEGWLNMGVPLVRSSPEAFVDSLSDALGLATTSLGGVSTAGLLEKLHVHADTAVHAQRNFIEEMEREDSTPEAATARWRAAWDDNTDDEEEQSSEPVNAAADTWRVKEFVDLAREGDINLAPSYQRSDVWSLSARQMLIESILRGIPLPSIILLNDQDRGASSPYDVVDGRQRLTSIFRFIGAHPTALTKVDEVDKENPDLGLKNLFRTDYPKFKRAWRSLYGSLSAKDEEKYYFPFKLRTGDHVMQGPLEALRGKYYSQIQKNEVRTAGGTEPIRKIFESASQYKVPVIVYTKATPKQIHEVFNLYNKQGVHLNAEEIRNAIFHELEITRAILLASGDFTPVEGQKSIAPSLDGITSEISALHEALESYHLTTARYRSSKIVSWVIATLLHSPDAPSHARLPRYGSTSKHLDSLLQRVQSGGYLQLQSADALTDLFTTLAAAAEVHSSVQGEVWTEEFKQGAKWLDLELVGSLVGVLAAAVMLGDDLADAMENSSDRLSLVMSSWKRPANAQSASQWVYVATIARGTVIALGVDPAQAHAAVAKRFGVSGLQSLFSLAGSDTSPSS